MKDHPTDLRGHEDTVRDAFPFECLVCGSFNRTHGAAVQCGQIDESAVQRVIDRDLFGRLARAAADHGYVVSVEPAKEHV